MADKHVVRLAPGMLAFYDPINRMHLMYPKKVEGSLPLDANLEYVVKAIKSGRLIDVNGTVLGKVSSKSTQSQEVVEPKEVEPPATDPLPEEEQPKQDDGKQGEAKQANKRK